jgi:hypothetical protein
MRQIHVCSPRAIALRCGNGATHDNRLPEWVAVPHSDGITGSERVGPKHRGRIAVEYFAAIDVSLEQSSVCMVDGTGKIVREGKVASKPEELGRGLPQAASRSRE